MSRIALAFRLLTRDLQSGLEPNAQLPQLLVGGFQLSDLSVSVHQLRLCNMFHDVTHETLRH